jgi:1,3-beta-glucan synthase
MHLPKLPAGQSVSQMPIFTVLTPHYSERILLTVREIISDSDPSALTRYTLLDYLKELYPFEWQNFITDTKLTSDSPRLSTTAMAPDQERNNPSPWGDVALKAVGFRQNNPQETMRTRVWASLRSQTLYRTIAGFSQYQTALRLLQSLEEHSNDVDNNNNNNNNNNNSSGIDLKFNFVVAMQRYQQLSDEEYEDVEFILGTFPCLKIAYIEEQQQHWYSCLIDASCQRSVQNGNRRIPRYRIRLPGPPILGDGKSDNQVILIIIIICSIFTHTSYLLKELRIDL